MIVSVWCKLSDPMKSIINLHNPFHAFIQYENGRLHTCRKHIVYVERCSLWSEYLFYYDENIAVQSIERLKQMCIDFIRFVYIYKEWVMCVNTENGAVV